MELSAVPNIPKKIAINCLHALNLVLHYIEDLSCPRAVKKLPFPPIFIIGPPRSGSTLLFQVLVNRYRFTHITNMHCLLYGAASFVERWLGPSWKKGGTRGYESWFGKSAGLWAPSECGQFWYRWFPKTPAHVTAEDVPDRKLRSFRRVTAALGNAGGQPILMKNLYCSVRLPALVKALPEALFIVVNRDVLRIGQSLLSARKNINGNYHDWLSVPPPEYERLKGLRPSLQVIGQTKAIYRLIDSNIRNIGEDRFIKVEYEDLCRDTRGELMRIEKFLAGHDIRLGKKGDVPEGFSRSQGGVRVNNNELSMELEEAAGLELEDILGESRKTAAGC